MNQFIRVAHVDDIPPGERLFCEFDEEAAIILNVDGEFFCVADLCTHDGGPLEDGLVDGYSIECPRHGACFDIRTGAVLSLPATKPIPVYPLKIEDGEIYVQPPD